jgi:probable HAF family extracellular repeat protein
MRNIVREETMTLSHCSKVRSLVLTTAVTISLGLSTHAIAQELFRPYFVDLNTRTVTAITTRESFYRGSLNLYPFGINDAGQVAGWSYNKGEISTSAKYAFITGPDGIGITELGTLAPGGGHSSAHGVNNAGKAVGGSQTAEGADHAFITGPDGVGMRDLGTLGRYSVAKNINDAGQVVGQYGTDGGDGIFITGPDGIGMRKLGMLGDSALDINEAGQVVGLFYPTTTVHAFITGPDGVGMRDLGTLGGSFSYAHGINEAGQVAGWAGNANRTTRAFITGPDGMGMRDLGALADDGGYGSSWAHDINDAGQVVGSSSAQGGFSNFHAFITGPNGEGMMDLNSLVNLPPGVTLTEATAVNNNGQVVAMGLIPEPETYALMLAGLGLLGFMVRRKKGSE